MEKVYPDTIKALRRKSGVSQKSLSKNLGISNRSVSKWENGLSQPSAEHILGLSKIFHVPIDCFYSKPHQRTVKNTTKGMGSVKEIYKIGRGPSSSHTIFRVNISPLKMPLPAEKGYLISLRNDNAPNGKEPSLFAIYSSRWKMV